MSDNVNLAAFNALPSEMAEAALLACCASPRWVRRMAQRRPFEDAAELFAAADAIWWELAPENWLEAFAAHPKIGEKPQQESGQARAWSEQEQAAAHSDATTRAALEQANQAYQERFGYIFIVCASGKTAGEMLAILRGRLQNDADAELRVAAEEQRKITELRLQKLLGL